jgi:hypothetical protein
MAARELSTWGWVFREQPVHDVGIDAMAEDCAGGFLTGRLIGLVFKAGRAFFSNPDGDGWLYHGLNEELSYWLSHTLPVVLLVHDPDTCLTYWQHFTPDSVTYTGAGWRTRIRADHVLGPDARQAFTAISHSKNVGGG